MANFIICILPIILFFATLTTCQNIFTYSRATFYGSPGGSGTPSGACGYGDFGRDINRGDVSAVSRLYRDGSGCGACYQVRCRNPQLCNDKGVRVVVTDHGEGDNTDFILSAHGFVKLARPNMAANLMAYGTIDVEYKRISCHYSGNNLILRVTENSRYPDYLNMVILNQGGKKDITAVALSQEDHIEWRGMRRSYGAVWEMVNPPKGPMNIRLQVTGDDGAQNWVQLTAVVPNDWKAGVSYDSAVQLT